MLIDDRFIDVDFQKEKQFVFGDRGQRAFRGSRPTFESSWPMIPESEWQKECEQLDANGGHLERLVTRILNQGQEGSCVGNATIAAHQIDQASQVGKENVVQLSPISVYRWIGSSPNSGSMVDDALEQQTNIGCLPLDIPENRARFTHVMPATGYYDAASQFRKWGESWKSTAALFRAHESIEITSIAGLVTASVRGFPIVVGRQGHSICYVRPTFRNGRIAFLYVNSWGEWGAAAGDFSYGFGLDTYSTVSQSASWAYAFRSVQTQ